MPGKIKILKRIPSICRLASYQPKVMIGIGFERELTCSTLKADSVMKFNSWLSSLATSKELAFDPQKDKCDIGFVVEDFKEDSIDEVKELFSSYYYLREPQCRMLNLTYEDHKDLLHDSLKEWIEKNVSAIARDRQSGKVVGCGLATVVTPDISSSSFSNSSSNNNYNLKARHNLQLDDIHKNSVDLFKKYNVETILQLEIANVNPNYVKRGVASRLLRECEIKGKSQGCQLASAVATNIYSQKALRSLGYTVEREMDFADMRIDGKQVLDLSKDQGTKTSQLLISRL